VVANNLMTNLYQSCRPGITFTRNLFLPASAYTGTTPCGQTDQRVADFGYVSSDAFDYHLSALSLAIGAGETSLCPAVDIDGQARPGASCDVGSDQR